jgi:hypothetical protein
MKHAVKFISGFVLILWAFTVPITAADLTLKPATSKAWDSYLEKAQKRIDNAAPLRLSAQRSVAVKVEPAVESGMVAVSDGLIHDWIGTTFIPNVTLAQLQAVVHDYDHYKDIYAPTVIDSKALEVRNGRETFSMAWFHKVLNIATGIDADYSTTEVDRAREGYAITRSTRIQEIRNLGRDSERKLPADTGSGYIWRVCTILRYEQADGGVYLRLEAIVLSRDIPHAVRWVANPIVNRLSRSSLAVTLTQTTEAIQARSAKLTGDALAQAR